MAAKKKASAGKKKASTAARHEAQQEHEGRTGSPLSLVPRAKVARQDYEMRSVRAMQPHPRNARRGNVEVIGTSVEENDFYGAVIVQKSTGYILVGNHRYKAAIEKGIDKIPAIVVDVDDERATKIMLSDNRTSDLATNDAGALESLLDELSRGSSSGLAGTGFVDADLAKMKLKSSPPEQFPEISGQVSTCYRCPQCKFEWS